MLFGILACIHINIESILLHIGQNPIISSLTAEYITYFLPGLFKQPCKEEWISSPPAARTSDEPSMSYKTVTMHQFTREDKQSELSINPNITPLTSVDKFAYLGSTISRNAKIEDEVAHPISTGLGLESPRTSPEHQAPDLWDGGIESLRQLNHATRSLPPQLSPEITEAKVAEENPGHFDFMFMTLARYLESQNLVRPMVMAACAGTVFTLFAQFFVLQWNLGLRASAGFLSISFGIMLLGEILYILRYRVYVETWSGKSSFIFMLSFSKPIWRLSPFVRLI
nr:unnamed protein product [Spirometra erinaceieuropaei]